MKIIKPISFMAALALPMLVNAVAIDFTQAPLATKSTPVKPNIMLMIDDSGSMSNSDSNDVFYTPGYNFNEEYACKEGANVLGPDNNETVEVYIERQDGSYGTAFFKFGGSFYALSENKGTINPSGNDNRTLTRACFDPKKEYNVKLRANDCNSSYCFPSSSIKTEIKKGNFLNWYLSDSSYSYYNYSFSEASSGNYSGSLTTDLSSPSKNFYYGNNTSQNLYKGYKRATSEGANRMLVAKDVASLLTAHTADVNIGVASFYYSGNNDEKNNGGEINRELLELGDLNVASGTEDGLKGNRNKNLSTINSLTGETNTPLAKTFAAVAQYYSLGSTKLLDPKTDKEYASSSFFDFNGNHTVKVNGSNLSSVTAPIDADTWCRKNYLVALTDGEPTIDSTIDSEDLRKWIVGDTFSSHLNDVAAAMYDLDLRPDIKNFAGEDVKNNVTTYTIGFSEDVTDTNSTVYKLLADTAKRGGGKFFAATSGTQLAEAFAEIKKDILSGSLSLSSVALSAVSELRTSNLSFKASYETSKWSGDLQAFFVNEDGLFQNTSVVGGELVGTGTAVNSTESITPVWSTASAINNMYVIENSPTYRSIDKRKIYTRGKNDYSAQAFTYANLASLPTAIQADIAVQSGGNATEARDLINFLRGDISYESNNPNASNKKYRSRVDLTVNASNDITDVESGSILGTVVNSAPVYLSESGRPWHDKLINASQMAYGENVAGKKYSDFKEYNKVLDDGTQSRQPMIYFGGNDGMLHAITVNGYEVSGSPTKSFSPGAELWAYVSTLR